MNIYRYYIIVKKLAYFLRKYDFPSTFIVFFENMIFAFENMDVSKKVNYLLRKYDLFMQEYAKATPIWNELTFLPVSKGFPEGWGQTVRFWGTEGPGGGATFLTALEHYHPMAW